MLLILNKQFERARQHEFIELLNHYLQNRIAAGEVHKLLGSHLTRDGTTYLLAVLCRCVQDNAGYKRGPAGAGQGQARQSSGHGGGGGLSQEPGAVGDDARIIEMASGVASSYEYYEESEEEPIAHPGR